eukprot:CAMPEP_0167782202 /NCGR_PEP_ID=MMETSP0111_2-20121227/6382_1 /TAXON_ID=91324 /ORGANISM="Lotharella globosa, Strain CCCM811" /LENGTH=523 /DNA_ID=CAMNT_0007672999 /DNA_START=79 /DNA_END=1650 /DNA_ORIENTATION=-
MSNNLLSSKLKKAARSKLVKTSHGAAELEKALGDEATKFLGLINGVIAHHYGEKVAKKSKEDTYRMLAKFDLHQQEGKQDPELKFKADRALNQLTRQFRISMTEEVKTEELKKAEVAALSIGFERMADSLVSLANGHMREKNLATLRGLVDQIASAEFLEKFLYDKDCEKLRTEIKDMLFKMYQEILEKTGEEFPDTMERKTKAKQEENPSMLAPNEAMNRRKTCAVASCGNYPLYSDINFCGNAFCVLHHFKRYPEYNQEGDVKLKDYLNMPDNRMIFKRFIELRGKKSLLEPMAMYHSIRDLNEDKDGASRAKRAKAILEELVASAGDQIPPSVQKKIQSLISEDNAPNWIFDSILPRIEEKLVPIYKKEFILTSAYKLFLQIVRLPKPAREQLAWQLSAENYSSKKGPLVGLNFTTEKAIPEGKKPPKIDTNAVLQPFAVEKDRSPTIRRVRPGDDEEEDPENPDGTLKQPDSKAPDTKDGPTEEPKEETAKTEGTDTPAPANEDEAAGDAAADATPADS